jgi:hypothetical protein
MPTHENLRGFARRALMVPHVVRFQPQLREESGKLYFELGWAPIALSPDPRPVEVLIELQAEVELLRPRPANAREDWVAFWRPHLDRADGVVGRALAASSRTRRPLSPDWADLFRKEIHRILLGAVEAEASARGLVPVPMSRTSAHFNASHVVFSTSPSSGTVFRTSRLQWLIETEVNGNPNPEMTAASDGERVLLDPGEYMFRVTWPTGSVLPPQLRDVEDQQTIVFVAPVPPVAPMQPAPPALAPVPAPHPPPTPATPTPPLAPDAAPSAEAFAAAARELVATNGFVTHPASFDIRAGSLLYQFGTTELGRRLGGAASTPRVAIFQAQVRVEMARAEVVRRGLSASWDSHLGRAEAVVAEALLAIGGLPSGSAAADTVARSAQTRVDTILDAAAAAYAASVHLNPVPVAFGGSNWTGGRRVSFSTNPAGGTVSYTTRLAWLLATVVEGKAAAGMTTAADGWTGTLDSGTYMFEVTWPDGKRLAPHVRPIEDEGTLLFFAPM